MCKHDWEPMNTFMYMLHLRFVVLEDVDLSVLDTYACNKSQELCGTSLNFNHVHTMKYASSNRAAAFDVTGRKTTETSSVIFRFSHKTAYAHGKKAVISTVILETQAARNLRSTTVSTITVVQLPCRLDRAATRPRVQVNY